MEQHKDYLPLGSVIKIKSSDVKLMIISRCVMLTIDETCQIADYGACIFPRGVMNEKIAYFNKEDIEHVYHRGYENELEEYMQRKMKRAMKKIS